MYIKMNTLVQQVMYSQSNYLFLSSTITRKHRHMQVLWILWVGLEKKIEARELARARISSTRLGAARGPRVS
jgi:hypothetical protein